RFVLRRLASFASAPKDPQFTHPRRRAVFFCLVALLALRAHSRLASSSRGLGRTRDTGSLLHLRGSQSVDLGHYRGAPSNQWTALLPRDPHHNVAGNLRVERAPSSVPIDRGRTHSFGQRFRSHQSGSALNASQPSCIAELIKTAG